jgi:hypothetical protein
MSLLEVCCNGKVATGGSVCNKDIFFDQPFILAEAVLQSIPACLMPLNHALGPTQLTHTETR